MRRQNRVVHIGKGDRLRKFKKIALITLIVAVLLFVPWLCLKAVGEPSLELKVENETDQTLTIYQGGIKYFDVLPKAITKREAGIARPYLKYFIEGVNNNGNILYSKIFTYDDLVTKRNPVTIPPFEQNPYLPLEVQNQTSDPVWVYVEGAVIARLEPNQLFKKRPLPSDLDSYNIRVESDKYDTERRVFPTFLSKTFTKSDLEHENYKIIVNP